MARLPFVTCDQLPADKQHIWDEIAKGRGSVLNVFTTLLNSPEAGRRVAAVGDYIRFGSKLRPHWREFAILIAARYLGSEYEYRGHVPIAQRAGVTAEMFAVIEQGKPVEPLPAAEQTIARYSWQLLRDHRVSNEVFERALVLLGRDVLVDLTVLLGYYMMLGLTLLAFDVEMDEVLLRAEK